MRYQMVRDEGGLGIALCWPVDSSSKSSTGDDDNAEKFGNWNKNSAKRKRNLYILFGYGFGFQCFRE